eukprot:GHRQ01026741.1.p1 GENE.GHRQ01026741.1~~GHRQ01026741.1.p1  ORF type:complete len:113 (+),score=3.51 GHRQ01026741.1:130-468(+)
MAQLTLTVLAGPAAGSSVCREANNKRINLGRIKTGNALPLNDPSVSSKHLAVLFREGSWFAEDLGSTNGTRLNDGEGKLLTGAEMPVGHGQAVQYAAPTQPYFLGGLSRMRR